VKRIGLLASLATVVVFFAVPTSAIAGWAGSPYEKSECTQMPVGDGGRPGLYCERHFTEEEVRSSVGSVPDSSCPSGFREIEQLQTIEVTWLVYDIFIGPVPLPQFAFAGNEVPVSERLISTTEVDLGCTP